VTATYTHSGLLALRAAAAAGVNITYKILYNDAVAMTGGQPAEGGLTVSQIAHQVWAEGSKRVAIVSDDPGKYPGKGYFPEGATVHHRREMDRIQRELREISGLSVLIYDQTCAAEKRRRRKRGLYPDPPKRVFINDLVCEGCGDCSQSFQLYFGPTARNRIRPQAPDRPVELQQGLFLRRGILSEFCHCPWRHAEESRAFLSRFRPAVRRSSFAASARTGRAFQHSRYRYRGHRRHHDRRAARHGRHLDGRGCSVLDFTGLAQKNGAVMSHVRIAPAPEDIPTVRIASGGADLILGCDIVVSASATALSRVERGVTQAIVNADLQPPQVS